MKKPIKLFLLAIILLISTLELSGCALINVNPERDNAEVIAKVNGEDIKKSDYNNYLALVQMNYESGDQQWPTGKDLTTLKENLYDSLLQQIVFAKKAKDNGDTIDEAKAVSDADEQITTLQEELGEDKYEKILTDNYSNPDDFKKWMEENSKQQEYSTKTTDKFEDDFKADPKKILDQAVGKINDTDVTRGQYEYRLADEALNYYMSNQTTMPTDEESMKETNKTIFENIDKTDANIKYCEDNKIDITDEEITTAQDSLKQNLSYFFQDDSQTENFLQSYYLTKATYDDYQKQQAKGDAAEEAIKKKCKDDIDVSDQEAETYYNDHSDEYDTSKVSAMHILTEDEDAANSIYDEAKDITTKEDFQKLVDKYKDVEGVKEATDLGEFDKKTMVQEFTDAAFNAEPNTVTQPVKTEFGYHVIYVYDKNPGETTPFTSVKEDIKSTLKDEKGEEEFNKIEDDLTKNVHYDIPDDIKSPLEEYASQLEEEYKVEKFENRIRA